MRERLNCVVLAAALSVVSYAALWGESADQSGPVGRWVFDQAHVSGRTVKDLAGHNDAAIVGPVRHRKNPEGLMLDGDENRIPITDDIRTAALPEKAMSAEAWVIMYTPGEWGGIVGAIQNNGNFEKGWHLGNRRGHFAFALSSVGADDGNGRATYLDAVSRVERGKPYHVVGTYDGAEMRIYVNGKLENATKAQSGNINYPKQTFYELGSYHDDNELYPLHGDLFEVRVYDRALSEAEVRSHFQSRPLRLPKPLRFKIGPYVRHVAMGEVVMTWQTTQSGAAVLEYGESPAFGEQLVPSAQAGLCRVRLAGLKPDTDYYFRITQAEAGGALQATKLLTFDSATDLTPSVRPAPRSPYPKDDLAAVYERAARHIVERAGVKQGYCLDLGCGEGRLAYEIAKLTEFQIIGVEEDAQKAAAARAALDKAGMYGVRITVHCGALADLPYASCFANLIVSDRTVASGKLPSNRAEVLRMLRPCGGVACFGQPTGRGKLTRTEIARWSDSAVHGPWKIEERNGLWVTARRGSLPGSGEWTHLYADTGNTACSRDQLRTPLQIQWFGRPGPRNMVDRHHRASAALWKDGRLFVLGNSRVLAVDAYNGAMLWDLEMPGSRRVGASKDCGQAVVMSNYVYVAAEDRCVGLDVETGEPRLVFKMPQLAEGEPRVCGYVASVDNLLFGSAEKPRASRTRLGKGVILDGIYYDHKPLVTSEYLFCLDRHTGERLWVYQRPGGSAIVNAAIAVGDGHVYFIESRNPKALADPDGRVTLDVLLAKGQAYLVKLDQEKGRVIWERPLEFGNLRHALFLIYASGTVLAVGSRNEDGHPRYDLHAFSAEDGETVWSNHYVRTDKKARGSHGEQDQHPLVIGGTVYSRPCAFDLKTGEKKAFRLDRGGHGCGGLTASAFYLYGRGGNPRIYPLSGGGSRNVPLTRVTRVGCWLNIIPAGGLVMTPESSSGCTCGYALQTSLALAPRSWK